MKPNIPPSLFPPSKGATKNAKPTVRQGSSEFPNTSRARIPPLSKPRPGTGASSDDYGDGGIGDSEFVDVTENAHTNFKDSLHTSDNSLRKKTIESKKQKSGPGTTSVNVQHWEPHQLANGKWACNHACKDKTACKHLCCREGTDKKPKPPKLTVAAKQKDQTPEVSPAKTQTKLRLPAARSSAHSATRPSEIEQVDLTLRHPRQEPPTQVKKLQRLHNSVQKPANVPIIKDKTPNYSYGGGTQPQLSFLDSEPNEGGNGMSTNFDDSWVDDFLDLEKLEENTEPDFAKTQPADDGQSFMDKDEEMLDAALVGFEDSQQLISTPQRPSADKLRQGTHDEALTVDDEAGAQTAEASSDSLPVTPSRTLPDRSLQRSASLFVNDMDFPSSGNSAEQSQAKRSQVLKRNRSDEHGAANSSYFATKRPRTNDPLAAEDADEKRRVATDQNPISSKAETETEGAAETIRCGEDTAESPRTAGLKAWLLDEFGDGIELI